MGAFATFGGTLFAVLVMMRTSLATEMLAVANDGMLAELAVALWTVAGFVGHGTDSLGGGCLGLARLAVFTSVGAEQRWEHIRCCGDG